MSSPFGTLVGKKLWDEKERKAISAAIADKNRELVGSGSNTLKLLVRKAVKDYDDLIIGATADATASSWSWDEVEVTVDERANYSFYVPFIHQKLGHIDFVRRNIETGLQVLAQAEDWATLKAAMGYTKVEDEDIGADGTTTTFTLDHSPIIKIISVSDGSTPSTVNYQTGEITFSSAPDAGTTVTYAYADSNTNVTYVDTAGTLDFDDILEAIGNLKARGFNADYLIIPPRAQMLLTQNLYGKYQFTQASTKIPGLIGAIGDTKVIVTRLMPDGAALVLSGPPDNPAVVNVYASDIEIKKWDRPDKARTDVYMDMWFKAVRVLDDAVELILGFASDATS